jgi:hypothetical protein
MATNGTEKKPLRIVVGSDNAGHAYKTALKQTLSKHAGVSSVMDVGVVEADDSTAYPHLAVDACKKIKAGEVRHPNSMPPQDGRRWGRKEVC